MRTGYRTRAIVVAVVMAGGLVAAAASHGAFDPPAVGAGGAALTACDTDGVRASLTAEWDAADGRYEIAAVTVTGVSDACDGQTLRVTLTDASGEELAGASLSVPTGPKTSFELSPASPPSAESAQGVHVVISG